MKIMESRIYDFLNNVLEKIQSRTAKLTENSFLLSNIDFFILLVIIATLIVSTFAATEIIGGVSFLVPVLVFVRTLIKKGEKVELEKSSFFLILYLLICLISCFASSMLPQSLYGFSKTLCYFAFYFAMCQFLKNNKHFIIFILLTVACMVSIESIIGLVQNSAGVQNIATWQDTSYVNPEDVLSRVYGTLKPYNPNLLGGYLAAGLSSVIALTSIYFAKKKYNQAVISLILLAVSSFCIFLTGSRGAYLALFAIFLSVLAASYQIIFYDYNIDSLKQKWKAAIAVFTAGIVSFLVVNHGILKRIMSIFILRADSSTSFRLNVYHSSFMMFKDNPIFGIGAGNKVFREIYGLYMLSGFDALSCYSVFLEIAVESGIFALIAFLLFLYNILADGIRKFTAIKDFNHKAVLFAGIVSVMAVMVHGLFDTVYFRPQIQFVFWTMSAIVTVLTREEKMA